MAHTHTLFQNGNFWQWTELPPPFVKRGKQHTQGEFVCGSLLVDNNTNEIVEFYKEGQHTHIADNCTIQPMENAYIIPGFQESHLHVLNTSIFRIFVDLSFCTSLNELINTLHTHRTHYPNQKWLLGRGWDQTTFTDVQRMPNRYDLDTHFPDIPVMIWRRCHHIYTCNTLALKMSNLDPNNTHNWDIPDDIRSQIIFDENGVCTGNLTEDSCYIVYKRMLATNGPFTHILQNELKFLAANGIVGVQTNDRQIESTYYKMALENQLPIRVFLTIFFEDLYNWLVKAYKERYPTLAHTHTPDDILNFSKEISASEIGPITGYDISCFQPATAKGMFSCDRIKLFADGSLGSKTAAMRTAYTHTSEDNEINFSNGHNTKQNFGVFRMTPSQTNYCLTLIKNLGLRAEAHAIGDAGAELIINGVIASQCNTSKHRTVLTHCQFLGEDLNQLMQQNNIIGNIQPSFLPSDINAINKFIQPSALSHAYTWKKMVDDGIVCSGGSDSPVESVNPFKGIFDLMYRPYKHYNNKVMNTTINYINHLNNVHTNNPPKWQPITHPPEAYNPSECFTFAEALRTYTVNGAYAANCDKENNSSLKLGKLEKGYTADFVVIDRDISQNSYTTLIEAQIMQTWLNGKLVYDISMAQNLNN